MTLNRKCHLVPPEEQRCVWMAAGVLSYQLCDRNLECDSCPLDFAMRHQPPAAARRPSGAPVLPVPPEPERLRPGLRYSRNHCWTGRSEHGCVRIGIEPGLGSALLAPKAVVFPSTGQPLRAGQTCLWIVTDGGTFPLESPIDGVVRATNPVLTDSPHLIHEQPFDKGWLCEVEPDLDIGRNPDLLDADQVVRRFEADQNRLRSLLSAALHGSHPQVGATMADGGVPLRSVAGMLGASGYFNLVRQVFAT